MSPPCRGDLVAYKCSHCQDGKLLPARSTAEPPIIIVEESLGTSGSRSGNDPVLIEMEMLGSTLDVERPSARRKKSKTPEEEAKIKAQKELKQDIQVYIAMLIVLTVAASITLLKIWVVKNYGPPPPPGPTFKPLPQVTGSNIMYNGNGFMPCNGFVPCQPDSLPPWKNALRLEGAMPGWREEWDGYQGVYKPPPPED